MNIDEEILNLIHKINTENTILNFAYNSKTFDSKKSWIYYSGPFWDENELVSGIRSLLTSKWISSGESVKQFERKFAQMVNDQYAVMVNSGSSANLCLMAACRQYFHWDDLSEIIVSSTSFPTTVAVIPQNDLVPVFVDIDFSDLNINLDQIEKVITKNSKAIFLAPTLGNPPSISKVLEICEKFNLKLLLDNCDSLGSKYNNKFLNEYAEISSNSLYASHILSTGEGGIVTSKNKELIDLARTFATWGRDCYCQGAEALLPNGMCLNRFSPWLKDYGYPESMDHKYFFTQRSWNLKPLDLQGAIGLEQIKKFNFICENRKKNYNIISELYKKYMPEIIQPFKQEESDPVWFGVGLIFPNKEMKKKVTNFLEKNRIQTRSMFSGNLLMHPGYRDLGDYRDYPNSSQVLDRVIFVGCAPNYSDSVFEYYEDVLKRYEQ